MDARAMVFRIFHAIVVAGLTLAASAAGAADTVSCEDGFKTLYAPLFGGEKLLDGGWVRQPESNTVVVFVHGIFSSNRDAWLNTADGSNCAYWPDLLATDPAFQGAGVFVASYYTSLASQNFDIAQAATHLASVLATPWPGHAYAPLHYPNVVFVSHSLGGVVTRKMLVAEWNKFRSRKLGVALMASPAKGSGWADRALWITRKLNNQMAQQLSPGDPRLEQIHQDFLNLTRQDDDGKRIAGMEQFENQFLGCGVSLGVCLFTSTELKNIVSEKDAGEYFGAAQIVPETDHGTIVKPDSLFRQSHLRLRNFYQNHFAGAVASFPANRGTGLLTLFGEKPTYGWKAIQPYTLRLSAYESLCGPQAPPQGCMAELPPQAPIADKPSPGARRWVAGPSRPPTAMQGDAGRYRFEEVLSATQVRVWARPDPGKAPAVVTYERDFTLEEYGVTGTEAFTAEQNFCATPSCTIAVTVPPGVQITRMSETTPMGVAETRWEPGQPVKGKVLRLVTSDRVDGALRHTFTFTPAYLQN